MTQKLDSSKKSGEEILQTIEPKGIADESMGQTVEILLATAIYGGTSFFLTNDIRLPSLPELTVLVLNNLIS